MPTKMHSTHKTHKTSLFEQNTAHIWLHGTNLIVNTSGIAWVLSARDEASIEPITC